MADRTSSSQTKSSGVWAGDGGGTEEGRRGDGGASVPPPSPRKPRDARNWSIFRVSASALIPAGAGGRAGADGRRWSPVEEVSRAAIDAPAPGRSHRDTTGV